MQKAAQRHVHRVLCGALLLAPALAYAAPAARVEFTSGDVTALDSHGGLRALRKGDPVDEGDTVDTHAGRAQLRFSDGAFVALQPDTQFQVRQYRYDGRTDGSERGFFALLKGGMRTISGLVGRTNKKNYKVETAIATIGIRGTEYLIHVGDDLRGSVGEGEIVVCNSGGCVNIASGQSFVAKDAQTRPVLTAVRTSLAPPQPIPVTGQRSSAAGDQTRLNELQQPPRIDDARSAGNQTAVPRAPSTTPGASPILSNSDTQPNIPVAAGQVDSGATRDWVPYAGYGRTLRMEVVRTGLCSAATFESRWLPAVGLIQRNFPQPSGIVGAGTVGSIIGWGRWMNSYRDGMKLVGLGSSQSSHYFAGYPAPAPALKRGEATYTLIAGTRPTGSDNGTRGMLNRATLFVDFTNARVATAFNVSYGGRTYDVSTRGGANALGAAQAGMPLDRGHATFRGNDFTVTGCMAPASCGAAVHGLLAGPAAERAGFVYAVTDGTSTPATAKAAFAPAPTLTVTGAAAFGRYPTALMGFAR